MVDEVLAIGDARSVLARGRALADQADAVEEGYSSLRTEVADTFEALREQMVRRDLADIPVARLRETGGRLRTGPLEQVGLATVLAVYDCSPGHLQQLPGIGETTANQLIAAARQVAAAIRDGLRVRVDLDPANAVSTALIVALYKLRDVERVMTQMRNPGRRLAVELGNALPAADDAGSRWRRVFSGRSRREAAQTALAHVRRLLESADSGGLIQRLGHLQALLREPADPRSAWREFERRSPEFYGLLGEIVDLGADDEAAAGFLPPELLAEIRSHPLDETFRRVSLRGYQAFGARFALARRRAVIGDEMGLGKTVQTIAVMCHLRSVGRGRFLVACPASVLVNWIREIHEHSALPALRLHGPDREVNQRTWQRDGGVAVTTLDSLHALEVPSGVAVDQFVVDEAHYVKNPQARRSRAVRGWTDRVERVLFLTGTPMENRVEEFKNLVDYLQPALVSSVDGRHGVAGSATFRRAVAPVYLRRNQDDVLQELPDLVHTDEWVAFVGRDQRAYRDAVASGNFMAMRRAAFAPDSAADSAKLARLLEIVDDAAVNGRKVVVFTYFRDVVTRVTESLDGPVFGPIAGDVAPPQRQAIVDDFSRVDGHAVLLSQIQAGGTGLNIQAASTVVICEPQVKPSLEDQAVARLHRMGQTRMVQAHRLLVENSVDQRMVEMLAAKSRLFDEYARRSDTADGSPEAVDVSEVELARRIVEEEQERLITEAEARLDR